MWMGPDGAIKAKAPTRRKSETILTFQSDRKTLSVKFCLFWKEFVLEKNSSAHKGTLPTYARTRSLGALRPPGPDFQLEALWTF